MVKNNTERKHMPLVLGSLGTSAAPKQMAAALGKTCGAERTAWKSEHRREGPRGSRGLL